MALRVYTYDIDSKSAKMLAAQLQADVRSIHAPTNGPADEYFARMEEAKAFLADPYNMVVGWGKHGISVYDCSILNNFTSVRNAIDKLQAFSAFTRHGVRCPNYVTSRSAAFDLQGQGKTLYARQDLHGADGAGLIVVKPTDLLPPAHLYTVGLTNVIDEYRLTVFKDKVVSTQKKVPVSGRAPNSINYQVRTTNGGWGFDVVSPLSNDLASVGPAACNALGLDMGGVDIVVTKDESGQLTSYVLEVNTAPALTPYSCNKLATAIKKYYDDYVTELKLSQVGEEDKTTFSLPADLALFEDTFTD